MAKGLQDSGRVTRKEMGYISQHKIVLGQSWSHSLMHQLVWVWAVPFAWLDFIKGDLDKERAVLCMEDVTVMKHKKILSQMNRYPRGVVAIE